jgi:hypothetical protein
MDTGLDAAFERLAASGFELGNGFVNHGPMACEALDALGIDADIESWAGRFANIRGGIDVAPVVDPRQFDGLAHLGDYARLPEWIGFFEASIRTEGGEAVVARWVPQLAPAFDNKLFHGAIRTAHATRALSGADTPARRAELARALAYWAGRYRPGPATSVAEEADVRTALLDVATVAARRYIDDPDIFTVHGVTSAMAAALLLPHLTEPAGLDLLAQVRATHQAFFGEDAPTDPAATAAAEIDIDWGAAARSASASHDPHQVKLVEACRRGFEATDNGAFAQAAAVATSSSSPRAT